MPSLNRPESRPGNCLILKCLLMYLFRQSIVSKSGDNSVRKTLTNARIGPYIFGKTLGLGSTGMTLIQYWFY